MDEKRHSSMRRDGKADGLGEADLPHDEDCLCMEIWNL